MDQPAAVKQAFRIRGGKPLRGGVHISPSKNESLYFLAADKVNPRRSHFWPKFPKPDVTDVRNMERLLAGEIEVASKLRASLLMLGVAVALREPLDLPFPGGCELGPRAFDIHVESLRKLGADITVNEDTISVRPAQLRGVEIYLRYPSVLATVNVLLAAAGTRGRVGLCNPACEPEVARVAQYLRRSRGWDNEEGTVRTWDVPDSGGWVLEPNRDRIEAGTFEFAKVMTGAHPCRLVSVGDYLSALDYHLQKGSDQIIAEPYPGFPTDLQPMWTAWCCTRPGTQIVTDHVFPQRFAYAHELRRMGASIFLGSGFVSVCEARLHGAEVTAKDLRGGAALVLAALAAEGESLVHGVEHIDRGYERFEEKLQGLGADIERITV